MKIVPEKRLFWFLRDGVTLDLTEPSAADLYVQQVLTRGTEGDVKTLLSRLDTEQLAAVLRRLQRFLPQEVRRFWEDFLGHPQ